MKHYLPFVLSMIKLANTTFEVHYFNPSTQSRYPVYSSFVTNPCGKLLVLIFAVHSFDKSFPLNLIKALINKNVGIVYFTDVIPKDAPTHPNISYVISNWANYSYNSIKSPHSFSYVFGVHKGSAIARKFSDKYDIPYLDPLCIDTLEIGRANPFTKTERLVIETFDGIGDIIMSLPTALHLHRRGIKIYYVVRRPFIPIFDNLEYVDHIYYNISEIKLNDYVYVSTSHQLSNYSQKICRQNRIDTTAALIGVDPSTIKDKIPKLVVTSQEINRARCYVGNTDKKVVITSLLAANILRCYPMNLACDVFRRLKKFLFVVVGNKELDIEPFDNVVNLSGKTSIRDLISLVYISDMVLTVDTGTLHIAGAFNKKTVALFGPIPPEWRTSYYQSVYVLESKARCKYCFENPHRSRNYYHCTTDNYAWCLRAITPSRIAKKIQELIE